MGTVGADATQVERAAGGPGKGHHLGYLEAGVAGWLQGRQARLCAVAARQAD
jgi:hypothetical protein